MAGAQEPEVWGVGVGGHGVVWCGVVCVGVKGGLVVARLQNGHFVLYKSFTYREPETISETFTISIMSQTQIEWNLGHG